MITSQGAPTKPYIKSLRVNGEEVTGPVLTHDQITHGGLIEFVMSDIPEAWGSSTVVGGGEGATRHKNVHVEL